MTASDYPDWGVPQAQATDISLTGAPLLRLTSNLGNATGVNVPAGGQVSLLALAAVNQPSYEATFVVNLPVNAGTIPFLAVTFSWVDATSGQSADIEVFIVPSGNGPAGPIRCYVMGPARGSQLTVTVTNLDPAQAAVFEDALAGVAAGRAGGFGFVVGVDRVGQGVALTEHGADVVVTDLAELAEKQ